MILLVILFWFALSHVIHVNDTFLPWPEKTFKRLLELFGTSKFWADAGASVYRVFIAFLLSFAIGYIITIVAFLNDYIRRMLFSVVEFFRYLPVPVFIPLTILWFGIGDLGKIMIVFLGTVVQMIPMFYDSFLTMKNKYQATSAALKLDSYEVVKQLIIPGSAPMIYDNARITFGWAWTYLIIAELFGAKTGMGYAIIRSQRYLNMENIFAYILVIGLIGLLTDQVFKLLKNKIFRWI